MQRRLSTIILTARVQRLMPHTARVLTTACALGRAADVLLVETMEEVKREHPQMELERQVERTMRHAGVSITVTSVTNMVRDAGDIKTRWVMLRARWVTRRAHWVTLRARWVTPPSPRASCRIPSAAADRVFELRNVTECVLPVSLQWMYW